MTGHEVELEKLDNLISILAADLNTAIDSEGDFPARTFYAKAFSIAVWNTLDPERFKVAIQSALKSIKNEKKDRKTYHFEFNRFALLHVSRLVLKGTFKDFGLARFTGVRVANWTLLRAYCRFKQSWFSSLIGAVEVFWVLLWFGRKNVLEDQKGYFTSQYHAFSCALLFEIAELTSTLLIRKLLLKIASRYRRSLSLMVAPGGEFNVFGRGCLQTFGYGAAVWALSIPNGSNPLCRMQAFEIIEKIRAVRETHAFLPLNIHNPEEGIADDADCADPRYPGWYSYNNYYDYLAFLTFCLVKAREYLLQPVGNDLVVEQVNENANRLISLTARDFVFHNSAYFAAVSQPTDRWCCGLPIPALIVNQRLILPPTGGEQDQPSIYSKESIPLPVASIAGKLLFFSEFKYFTTTPAVNVIVFQAKAMGIMHKRSIIFLSDQVIVEDIFGGDSIYQVSAPRIVFEKKGLRLSKDPDTSNISILNQNITISCSHPLEINSDDVFSVVGRSVIVSARCNSTDKCITTLRVK